MNYCFVHKSCLHKKNMFWKNKSLKYLSSARFHNNFLNLCYFRSKNEGMGPGTGRGVVLGKYLVALKIKQGQKLSLRTQIKFSKYYHF